MAKLSLDNFTDSFILMSFYNRTEAFRCDIIDNENYIPKM